MIKDKVFSNGIIYIERPQMNDLRVRFPCVVVAERRVQAAGIKPIRLVNSLAWKIPV